MKKIIIFICIMVWISSYGNQPVYKYYVYLADYKNPPTFIKSSNNNLIYSGNDLVMQSFFSKYAILSFKQAFPSSKRASNLKVYEVTTLDFDFIYELLRVFPDKFLEFEDITDMKYELEVFPNDYGVTNPNGNMGSSIDRSDLDYINISKAWDITTGNGIVIGVSDARIKEDDPDFLNKVIFINPPFSQDWLYDSDNGLTFHGTNVSGIAAAQGNNNYGSTGVCFDCQIVSTDYGNYDNLLLLAMSGVRVINMSWVNGYYSLAHQKVIDEIVQDYNTVLVAAAGNYPSHQTNEDAKCVYSHWVDSLNKFVPNFIGMQYFYPASYNGVISVSGIGHKYPTDDSTTYEGVSPLGFSVASYIKNSFSPNVNVSDLNNPVGLKYHGWGENCINPYEVSQNVSPNGIVWTYTFNEKVDILAPGYTNFNFSKFAEENGVISYYLGGGTSLATPYVSGTVALMLSINNCLTPSMVDTILKLTTKDVEVMSINQNFTGNIGAGALDAGDAVKFVDEMKKINGNAVIDNHMFNRFNFVLDKINNDLTLENVTFKDDCTVNFTAKDKIHLLPNTYLLPNVNGGIHLNVDSSIAITCESTRSVLKPSRVNTNEKANDILESNVVLYPNPNDGNFQLLNLKDFENKEVQLQVFDLNNRVIYNRNLNKSDLIDCKVDLSCVSSGLYVLKLSVKDKSSYIKFVKN